MPTSAQFQNRMSVQHTGTNDYGGPDFSRDFNSSLVLADGNGANQINQLFADQRIVASATNDDLDLIGVLFQPNGAAFAPTTLVSLKLINAPIDPSAAPNTTTLTIGGATNPVVGLFGTTSTALKPGGVIELYSGAVGGLCSVVAATGDILRIANSAGASNTYQIILTGRA